MHTWLQNYLADRSFKEVEASGSSQSGATVHAYENGQFRLHVVNERKAETYIQVAPQGRPQERWFLAGVVAFLTRDDSATRRSGDYERWLREHHDSLARLFSPTAEGQQQREQYATWQHEFAAREQTRLAEAAAERRAKSKPWWRVW